MFVNLDKKFLSVSPLCYLQKAWFGLIFLQQETFSKKKKKLKWLASRFWEFTNFYIYFFSAKEFGKKKKEIKKNQRRNFEESIIGEEILNEGIEKMQKVLNLVS